MDNDLTKEELVEAITHLVFYAGWPNAMSGITAFKDIVAEPERPSTSEKAIWSSSGRPSSRAHRRQCLAGELLPGVPVVMIASVRLSARNQAP